MTATEQLNALNKIFQAKIAELNEQTKTIEAASELIAEYREATGETDTTNPLYWAINWKARNMACAELQ